MQKDWFINAGIFCASLVLSVLVIEFGLRVSGLQTVAPNPPKIYQKSANPEISYELIPGVEEQAYRATVTTNRQGFRSEELPEGKKLFPILGDSIAFGYGVGNDETLASRLTERNDEWFFLNAAAPGYTLGQEIATYNMKIRPLNPDGLLILFYWNDLDGFPPGVLDDQGILRPAGWVPGSEECQPIETGLMGQIPGRCFLDQHSAFYKAFKKLVNLIHGKSQLREDREQAQEGEIADPTKTENLQTYLKELTAFGQSLPTRMQKIFVIWPDRFLHEKTKPGLIAGARRAGFTVIDLEELFGNEVPLLSWDTVHPNAEAFEKAAEFIGGYLKK